MDNKQKPDVIYIYSPKLDFAEILPRQCEYPDGRESRRRRREKERQNKKTKR